MRETTTIEDALKELREMFPGQRVSVAEKRRLLAFPDVKLKIDEEFDYVIVVGKGWNAKESTAPTLSEAMGQAHQWKESQQ